LGFTIALTTASALTYALSDVLLQHWAPQWGLWRFIPVMFGLMGVFSFGFMAFFQGSLRAIEPSAWRWLAPGAVLMAGNNAAFAFTLARWHDATAANVVYSSRGLWAVALVWGVGHWFGNQERQAGGAAMGSRLIGAALMVVAIVLVVR
jgi:hypothetical protein